MKISLPKELNDTLDRVIGDRTSKSRWIAEAVQRRLQCEESADILAGLPQSARLRIARYIELVRQALRDEELAALERAWEREEDPKYYAPQLSIGGGSWAACAEAMIGRGASRHSRRAPSCD